MQLCTRSAGMAQHAGAPRTVKPRHRLSQLPDAEPGRKRPHRCMAQQQQQQRCQPSRGPCLAVTAALSAPPAAVHAAIASIAWRHPPSAAAASHSWATPSSCTASLKMRRRALAGTTASAALSVTAASVAAPAATAAAAATTAAAAPTGVGALLAVVLGWCVMVGSLFRSVPQITKILQAQSTEGLSLTSNVVELLCYTVILAYNLSQGYAFNTFGEVWACWAQDIILVGLIYHYTRMPLWQALGSAALFAASCAWLLGSCPPALLASLQASTILVMALGSRVPQIVLNMKRGDAGVLSVTTCLLNVAGNAARAFTTVVLTGDMLLLGGVVIQGALNGVLLFQSVQSERGRHDRGLAAVPAPA